MTSRQIKAAQLRHRMAIQAMTPHRLPKRPTEVERHMADTAVDMLVLIVGMRANDDNAAFAEGAGLNRAPSGFLAPRDMFLGNVKSNVDGIFYAGTITAPKNIGESLNEGIAAADAAAKYVEA